MSPHIISVHLLCAFIYTSVDVLKNNELNIVLFKVGCNKIISVFDQKYSGLSRKKKKKDFSKNGMVVEIKEKNLKMKNSKK